MTFIGGESYNKSMKHKCKFVDYIEDNIKVRLCLHCGKLETDVLFEEGCGENTERYGFHCWAEDSPWQANAIKILEDLR